MNASNVRTLPILQKLGSHGMPTNAASMRKGIGMAGVVEALCLPAEVYENFKERGTSKNITRLSDRSYDPKSWRAYNQSYIVN